MPREFITASELASRLGVSRMTVHRWVAGGKLPAPIHAGRVLCWPERIAAGLVRAFGRPDPGQP